MSAYISQGTRRSEMTMQVATFTDQPAGNPFSTFIAQSTLFVLEYLRWKPVAPSGASVLYLLAMLTEISSPYRRGFEALYDGTCVIENLWLSFSSSTPRRISNTIVKGDCTDSRRPRDLPGSRQLSTLGDELMRAEPTVKVSNIIVKICSTVRIPGFAELPSEIHPSKSTAMPCL